MWLEYLFINKHIQPLIELKTYLTHFADKLKAEADGGVKAGVQGTPGSIIVAKNGKKDFINGALPVDQIKAQIDKLLQ